MQEKEYNGCEGEIEKIGDGFFYLPLTPVLDNYILRYEL